MFNFFNWLKNYNKIFFLQFLFQLSENFLLKNDRKLFVLKLLNSSRRGVQTLESLQSVFLQSVPGPGLRIKAFIKFRFSLIFVSDWVCDSQNFLQRHLRHCIAAPHSFHKGNKIVVRVVLVLKVVRMVTDHWSGWSGCSWRSGGSRWWGCSGWWRWSITLNIF